MPLRVVSETSLQGKISAISRFYHQAVCSLFLSLDAVLPGRVELARSLNLNCVRVGAESSSAIRA
eukprot:1555052-Rhodomonas_salina.1